MLKTLLLSLSALAPQEPVGPPVDAGPSVGALAFVEVEGGGQAFKLDEGLGAGDGVALRCTFEVLGHGRVEGQGGGVGGV